MKVTLKKSLKKHSLSFGKVYHVIGIEADNYRIIDDDGEPYLFPSRYFYIVDRKRPEEWIITYGEDNEKYAYPKEMNEPGFFEDYFDNDEKTKKIFWNYINIKTR